VGDVTFAHAGSISSTGDNLTLSAFAVEAGYLPQLGTDPCSSSARR
jgi:hypothetical protein